MASTLISSIIVLISILITVPPSMSRASETYLKGFEARLIHRDSPASPLYNPKATHADLITSARSRTVAKKNYFNWLRENKTWRGYASSYARAPIDQFPGAYIMKFKIGTPAVDTFGLFDTGSHLTWLQCEPCERCFNQTIPIYNPASSHSYEKVMCGSVECNIASSALCPNTNGECKYKLEYSDGSFNEGDIATETITLEEDGLSGAISLAKIIIGCGHSNVDTTKHPAPGVVGLNRQPISLVSQIPVRRFSYCIPSQDKGNHSSVKFGSPAVITEKETQTPLLSGEYGFYHLSLEGISIDGTLLNISRSVFEMKPGGQLGVIMDSGTTYTLLAFDAFIEFKLGMMNALSDFKPVTDVYGLFPLCYDYYSGFRLDMTPEIVFHFTGLEFPLNHANTWIATSMGHYCLAMQLNEGSSDDYTIFGMYQQQNVNVGYDLANNIVSLKYSNCE